MPTLLLYLPRIHSKNTKPQTCTDMNRDNDKTKPKRHKLDSIVVHIYTYNIMYLHLTTKLRHVILELYTTTSFPLTNCQLDSVWIHKMQWPPVLLIQMFQYWILLTLPRTQFLHNRQRTTSLFYRYISLHDENYQQILHWISVVFFLFQTHFVLETCHLLLTTNRFPTRAISRLSK